MPSSGNPKENTIYQHILIPTDGSALSSKAVKDGVALAQALGAKVTFFTATSPFSSIGDLDHAFAGVPELVRQQALSYLESEARNALAAASAAAAAAGVEAGTFMTESNEPYEAIIAAAKSKGADLIFMASHGRRGVKAVILGSVTQKILTHTELPVLVCR